MTDEDALILYKLRSREILKEKNAITYSRLRDYNFFSDILTEEDFKKALRLKNRRHGKRRRCFDKVRMILNKYLKLKKEDNNYNFVFCTCTIDEEHIQWKEETITKTLNKWVKEHNLIAVVNADYGDQKGRLHFHFVGITKEELEYTGKRSHKTGYKLYNIKDNKNYILGFEPDYEIISLLDTPRKVSNYLVKVGFHGCKISAINRRIRVLKNYSHAT